MPHHRRRAHGRRHAGQRLHAGLIGGGSRSGALNRNAVSETSAEAQRPGTVRQADGALDGGGRTETAIMTGAIDKADLR
ncbi:hypothetical protein [Rhodopseudomonas pseudopalustris]|uniref:Uncharacterized protein n=1 Tax=Rhodopseudomonas pseudopalustris TaxID=1513892 RepID=A0A1H8W7J9_9BRAD|nr:hypothetical protein [Rhodopseudomonas pseudopalustris]SEP23397.1 hypothetical protein SAMN05444123_11150 [Rhodopseudomonas pseudopalustris]